MFSLFAPVVFVAGGGFDRTSFYNNKQSHCFLPDQRMNVCFIRLASASMRVTR
jgi:hypothetical protein